MFNGQLFVFVTSALSLLQLFQALLCKEIFCVGNLLKKEYLVFAGIFGSCIQHHMFSNN